MVTRKYQLQIFKVLFYGFVYLLTRVEEETRRKEEELHLEEQAMQLAIIELENKKATALKLRDANVDKRKHLNASKRNQLVTRNCAFSYFTSIPRQIWELPIGWQKKPRYKSGGSKTNK